MSIWPFRRRKPEPRVIIDDNWPFPMPCNPKKEDVLRVARISPARSFDESTCFIGLGFENKPPCYLWSNNAFRKAHLAHEPATESLYEMIRRHTKTPQPQET